MLQPKKQTGWLDKVLSSQEEKPDAPVEKGWLDSIFTSENERKLNTFIGDPQGKAIEDSLSAANLLDTPEDEEVDPIDSVRHAAGGRYTTEALLEKTGNPLFSIIASNLLGAAHELKTGLKDERGIETAIKEGAEDLFNNGIGSFIGVLPMSSKRKTDMIQNLALSNLLPDGVTENKNGANLYVKNEKGKVDRTYKKMSTDITIKKKAPTQAEIEKVWGKPKQVNNWLDNI